MPLSPRLQFSRQRRRSVFGGARFEAHEGVSKIIVDVVVLRAEVIRLGLSLPAPLVRHLRRFGACGAEWGPCCQRISNRWATCRRCPTASLPMRRFEATRLRHLSSMKLLTTSKVAEALTFVPNTIIVGCVGGAAKPTFVDTATIEHRRHTNHGGGA